MLHERYFGVQFYECNAYSRNCCEKSVKAVPTSNQIGVQIRRKYFYRNVVEITKNLLLAHIPLNVHYNHAFQWLRSPFFSKSIRASSVEFNSLTDLRNSGDSLQKLLSIIGDLKFYSQRHMYPRWTQTSVKPRKRLTSSTKIIPIK